MANTTLLHTHTSDSKFLLQTVNLTADYGQKNILQNISFSVKCGELVCIIGPNGSGKSTFLALLAGIERSGLKTKGIINLNGHSIESLSRREIATYVSFMTQTEHNTWDFSVRDIILTGRFSHTPWTQWYSQDDYRLVENAMQELAIMHLADRPIHSLSGGEFQRVRIARSLVQQSPLLLLDEPVANLDFGCQHVILKKLQSIAHSQNTAVIVAIHDLNVAASFADRIALLHPFGHLCSTENQLITGTTEELFIPDILNKVYGSDFRIFKHPVFGYPQVYVHD